LKAAEIQLVKWSQM